MSKKYLYFLLNPYTGLVKIGVADDIGARQFTLECAAGVRLRLLASVPRGEIHEKILHEIFWAQRTVGEWFFPTEELLGLIDDPASIGEFIRRSMPAVEARRAERAAAAEPERLRKEAEKKAAAEARKEAERKKREALKRREEARARREQARRETDERLIEESRQEWLAKQAEAIKARGLITEDMEVVRSRTREIMTRQQTRNAALNGVKAVDRA